MYHYEKESAFGFSFWNYPTYWIKPFVFHGSGFNREESESLKGSKGTTKEAQRWNVATSTVMESDGLPRKTLQYVFWI